MQQQQQQQKDVTLERLQRAVGQVVPPTDIATPLIIKQAFADHNPPIHVIIEDSSWNICRDNSNECYDFKNMHKRLAQDADERFAQEVLFNEEPPLRQAEVECLLANWLAFITDSSRRTYRRKRNVTFHELTVPMLAELAEKLAADVDSKMNITEDYPCTIVLTAKSPQKFWVDLFNDTGEMAKPNGVRTLVREQFNFMLVSVSRLPIQWYFAKKSRQLPDQWWSSPGPDHMNSWQVKRYDGSYSIPIMFLDRTKEQKEPQFDVIFNYVLARHLELLNSLLLWRFPGSADRNTKVWWQTLKSRGYKTDKDTASARDRQAIIQQYKGPSPSPYTFDPKATYGSTDTPAGYYDGESGDDEETDADDEVPKSVESKSSDVKDAAAATEPHTGLSHLQIADKDIPPFVAALLDMHTAIDEVLVQKPATILTEDWETQRRIEGLPDASDTKSVLQYLGRYRDALIQRYADEGKVDTGGKLVLPSVLSDALLEAIWNDKLKKAKAKQASATLSVAGRASMDAKAPPSINLQLIDDDNPQETF